MTQGQAKTQSELEPTVPHRKWPRTVKIDDIIYVGGQLAIDAHGNVSGPEDIEAQTEHAFDNLVESLRLEGAQMSDLAKLNTYYQYNGAGRAVTEYWERMTQVRLRYLPNPGPAGTAVRVAGAPTSELLIEVDGIAIPGRKWRRLMPKHAWDWSIPTPFSQGWRIGNKVILGGQISADRQGKALAPGDVREQTRNTLEYIRHVLIEGGAGWKDLVTLKICFKSVGQGKQDRELLSAIIDEVRRTIPEPRPALTVFGVDLLYEGLVLEIDGVAVIGDKAPIVAAGGKSWINHDGFPQAWRSGDEIFVGGLSAPGAAGLAAQAEATLERLRQVLQAASAGVDDLAKISVFFVAEGAGASMQQDYDTIQGVLSAYLPEPGPVVSIVSLPALAHEGQRFQLDGIVVRRDERRTRKDRN